MKKISICMILLADMISAFTIRQHQAQRICPTVNRYSRPIPCGITKFHAGNEVNKIYRGIPAKLFEFPFAMPILFTINNNETLSDTLCTGTLISEKYLITAAHCFPETNFEANYTYWTVYGVVKSIKQAKRDTCHKYKPVKLIKIINHPQYHGETGNDMALAEMEKPMPKELIHSGFHRIACLPDAKKYYGDKYTIYGFGYDAGGTADEKKHPIKLSHAEVEERPRKLCDESWRMNGRKLNKDEICMSEVASMGCVGDSGGPILYIKNNVHTIVGVLHGGTQCNSTKEIDDLIKSMFGDISGKELSDTEKQFKKFKGAIYTQLGYHLDWICKITKICSRNDQTLR